MIWDAISKFGNQRPVLMRGIIGTASFVIFGYVALAALTSEIIEGNRQSCERGNASRLISYRLVTAEKNKAAGFEELRLNEGKIAEAHLYREEKDAAEDAMEGYVSIAEESGHQNARGAVTINCTDEWPKPLPWLGG